MIKLFLNWVIEFLKCIFAHGAVLASWATVIGVVGAFFAYRTYKNNNSIKKWELITKIYDAFTKDDWYEFYKRIQKGEQIDLESKEEEKRLNETLTLFDALDYFRTQKLLDEKAWEYVACEIQNFALNNSVWKYMRKIEESYQEKGFPAAITPFTGFPGLLDDLPKKFTVKCPPQFEERFKLLSQEEKNDCYSKVKDTPNKYEQLKHAAAIGIFAKAERGTISEEKDNGVK